MKSTIVKFKAKSTLTLTQELDAELATYIPAYTGDKKVIMDAFDASLSNRLGADVSLHTLEHHIKAVFTADGQHNSSLVVGEKPSYKAQQIPRTAGWAMRDAIKAVCSHRFVQKTRHNGEGVAVALPIIGALHDKLVAMFTRLREANVLFFDTALDLPLWETWTNIGFKPDGSPEFQKAEFWKMEDFTVHVASKKFAQGLAQWVVADALRHVELPTLSLPSNAAAEHVLEGLAKSLKNKATRATEEGKQVWDYKGFYKGGCTAETLKEGMSLMEVLAMVGRVVQQHNNVVNRVNTRLGASILRMFPKGGEEIRETSIELLDFYEVEITFDNYNPENGVSISGTRQLELDLAAVTAAVDKYLMAWKKIIGVKELALMGLAFHGGFKVDEREVVCDKGVTTTTTFDALPEALYEFVPFSDADTARFYAEKAFQSRVEKQLKLAAAFVPQYTSL